MKKLNQQGALDGMLIIALLLVLAFGAFAFSRINSADEAVSNVESSTETATNNQVDATTQESEDQALMKDGIAYNIPDGWSSADSLFESADDSASSDDLYLLSPDYKEGGQAQFTISSGAYMTFSEWSPAETVNDVDGVVDVLRQSDAYIDIESISISDIAGIQVVQFDTGHTTDGVSTIFQLPNGEWLSADYSTGTSDAPGYNAQSTEHYSVYEAWLKELITLNSM